MTQYIRQPPLDRHDVPVRESRQPKVMGLRGPIPEWCTDRTGLK